MIYNSLQRASFSYYLFGVFYFMTHYVYRLSVGRHTYYGRTENPDRRILAHRLTIVRLVNLPEGMFKPDSLNFHNKAARFLRQKKCKVSKGCTPYFSSCICYQSECLDDVKDVELYLIHKSAKNKFCHNVKTTK